MYRRLQRLVSFRLVTNERPTKVARCHKLQDTQSKSIAHSRVNSKMLGTCGIMGVHCMWSGGKRDDAFGRKFV